MIARSLFCLLLLTFPLFVFAQETDDAAKEKQRRQVVLINQLLGDIPTLKLGENRALVYAKVGSLVWKNDEKLAEKDFDRTMNLINGFSRRESQITLKMQLAEGILN